MPVPATYNELGDGKQTTAGKDGILKTLSKIIYSNNSDPQHWEIIPVRWLIGDEHHMMEWSCLTITVSMITNKSHQLHPQQSHQHINEGAGTILQNTLQDWGQVTSDFISG